MSPSLRWLRPALPPALPLAFLVAIALSLASPLLAQVADSSAVQDKLGVLGPVLDHFWGWLIGLLASASVWVIGKLNAGFKGKGEPVKWLAVYGFNLLYNIFAKFAGLDQVDPAYTTWAGVGAFSVIQTATGALIFKLGGHRTPVATPTPAAAAARDPRDFGSSKR